MCEDNNLLLLREKDGEHDNVNQLMIQQNSPSPQDPVTDSVLEARERRNQTQESLARLDQQGTRKKRAHSNSTHLGSIPQKRRHTSSLEAGSEVILKSSTYPNKRIVAYATIRSTDPTTKADGIQLGSEFTLVRIDEPIVENEELVREVGGCKTIGDASSSGFLIAWPSALIRKKN